MILFITPNPCIERTYLLDNFDVGKVHRVDEVKVLLNAGGKGINAARVASQFYDKVLSLCPVGQDQRQWLDAQLDREHVPHRLIETPGQTRTCINILREGEARTEIVEAGMKMPQETGTQLLEQLKVLLPQSSLLAVCGSYPPADPEGSLDDHLQQIALLAQQHQVRLLVDGKGAAFKQLLESRIPLWAIKPNTDEAADIIGSPFHSAAEERDAVKVLLRYNVETVILSCGKRGAYLGTKDDIQFFPAPTVQEVSAVGSGDALVGAFCASWRVHGHLEQALQIGIAAGAANATQVQSAFCNKAEIEEQGAMSREQGAKNDS